MPRELTKNFKKCHFVVVFLKCYFEVSYFTQQQRTISPSDCGVWWKVDFIHYQQWPAQWLDWEEAPKHFPKPNLHQKRSWSLFGGLLPIWPVIAFWILASPYVWEVCSAHQWDAPKTAVPTVGIGQQKGPSSSPQQRPTSHHTANTSEVEWIELWSFASSAIFPWPLTNWLQLLQASQQLFIERLLP